MLLPSPSFYFCTYGVNPKDYSIFIRALGDVDSAALGHTHPEPPGSGAINTIVKLQNLSSVLGLETWRQFFSLRSMTEVWIEDNY